MKKEHFYKSLNLIEKALHDVKANLEVFLGEDVPEALKPKLFDAFDRLDSTWDELAGILNQYDDGKFDEVLEEKEKEKCEHPWVEVLLVNRQMPHRCLQCSKVMHFSEDNGERLEGGSSNV